MSGRAKVLDSWGLLALFEGQKPASDNMEECLARSRETATPLLMSAVNLGEVWYIIARRHSETVAEARLEDIRKMGVEVVPADWDLTRQAAQFKVRGRISYADCFALALAKRRKAELVTGDPEYKAFERDVKIGWL